MRRPILRAQTSSRAENLPNVLFNRSAHSTGPGNWRMNNLTSNVRWMRGKCQEHLKQGRGRWRERPEERDSLPSSSGDQLECAWRVRRYFRGGACSHEGLRLPTCSSLLQSTKMGKWLQERGPGVSLGGLRGSLGRSFGDPGRSPVGFWIVLGGVRVSLLGAQGRLWTLSLLSWGS